MEGITAGRPLIRLVRLAYRAGQPILLCGRHGVGKSELLVQCAEAMGIACIVRDLSLMEPPDLGGLPESRDGRTHFLPPAFLPQDGEGLLVLEELNRAQVYMQGPCLQLLTARRLNDYQLPTGWLPCASINPDEAQYFTSALDDALLSRFMQVAVEPDVDEWALWARESGVHGGVIGFVQASPGVFEDAVANPRAWTYASNIVGAWEQERDASLDGEGRDESLHAALAGILGDSWSAAFLEYYLAADRSLEAQEILTHYPAHRARFRERVRAGQLDVVAASLELLKRYLQQQRKYDAVLASAEKKKNVESFFSDLPADVRRQVASWLKGRGFDALRVRTARARKTG